MAGIDQILKDMAAEKMDDASLYYDVSLYYGGLKDAPKHIYKVKHFIGEEMQIKLPGYNVGFKYSGGLTLCFIWVGSSLRIGTANCSPKDKQNKICGEKVAFRRAIEQHDLNIFHREILWDYYLLWRNIKEKSFSLLCIESGLQLGQLE